MSIGAGIVVAISFQKIDNAPYAEARADSGHEGLKDLNTAAEKCHKITEVSLDKAHQNKKAPEIIPVLRKLALFLSLLYLLIIVGDKGGSFIPRELPVWAAGYIASFFGFLLSEIFCIDLHFINIDHFFPSHFQFTFQKALHIKGVSLVVVR